MENVKFIKELPRQEYLPKIIPSPPYFFLELYCFTTKSKLLGGRGGGITKVTRKYQNIICLLSYVELGNIEIRLVKKSVHIFSDFYSKGFPMCNFNFCSSLRGFPEAIWQSLMVRSEASQFPPGR